MLDWIFEGIVTWIASVVSELFDAVSGLFLDALGTDMTAMEEYFPFMAKVFDMDYHSVPEVYYTPQTEPEPIEVNQEPDKPKKTLYNLARVPEDF